jgi:glycosyltransferase involved in cell wall biosynthesis
MSRNIAMFKENNNIFPVPQPMFSVVISTRNRASLLERALKSLLLQTETGWEAIIVDDGSTDDTYEKILPLLCSCRTLKYIWKPHSGAVPSRNFGIRSSRGKFVTFLDSDDEYHPFHLEYRRKFLINNPDVQFLYGGAEISGNPYVPDKNNPSRKINLKDCLIGGTFVIEREVVLSLNGFRVITLGSDSDMYERIRKAGIKMAEIKFPTYIYHRENQDSITNKLLKKVSAI